MYGLANTSLISLAFIEPLTNRWGLSDEQSRILLLLQRPIAFHRVFVPLGGVTGAVLLSQMLYWSDKGESEWIYKTQADWYAETGLTHRTGDCSQAAPEIRVLLERACGHPFQTLLQHRLRSAWRIPRIAIELCGSQQQQWFRNDAGIPHR